MTLFPRWQYLSLENWSSFAFPGMTAVQHARASRPLDGSALRWGSRRADEARSLGPIERGRETGGTSEPTSAHRLVGPSGASRQGDGSPRAIQGASDRANERASPRRLVDLTARCLVPMLLFSSRTCEMLYFPLMPEAPMTQSALRKFFLLCRQ